MFDLLQASYFPYNLLFFKFSLQTNNLFTCTSLLGTVELLAKIFGSISVSASQTEEIKEHEDYSDAWDVKDIGNMDFWFLRPGVLVVQA